MYNNQGGWGNDPNYPGGNQGNNQGGFNDQNNWGANNNFNTNYNDPNQGGYYQNQGNFDVSNNYGQQNFGNQNMFSVNSSNFADLTIPDNFQMKQKILTFGVDLQLIKDGLTIGIIKQKLLNIGTTFSLENVNGNVVAVARQKVIAIGKDFDIFNGDGVKLGSVTQEVMKSAFTVGQRYVVKNVDHEVVAYTKQVDILKSNIEVLNSGNGLQAKFDEGLVHIVRDSWQISFYGTSVDRRLLVFFPAFASRRQQKI